jgi:predicted DNA-binding transcriptional regulator AlpA
MVDADARDCLINERVAAKILGISCDTLRRLGQRDEGPRRRKISPRRVGYKLSEVEAYRDGAGLLDAAEPTQRLSACRRTPQRRSRTP